MLSGPIDFHLHFNDAPDAMFMVDQRRQVAALNAEATRLFGWTEDELKGEPVSRFIAPYLEATLTTRVEDATALPDPTTGAGPTRFMAFRRDGSEFPVELWRRPLVNGSQTVSLVTVRDLTQWRSTPDIRSRRNDRARDTLESIGDAVITTDIDCEITYLNAVAEHLTGWTAEEALGQTLDVILPLILEATGESVPNTARRCLAEGRSIDLEEGVVLVRRDGTRVAIGDSAAPVRKRSGEVIGVVLVIQDESEKRRVGHRLSHEATHDELTGLINRREFERRLARQLDELIESPMEHALICIDLDRFKLVNDSCGHEAGDELLKELGPLLSQHLRKHDALARLGGDEFGVVLENCPPIEAKRIAEVMRLALERHRFDWSGREFDVRASIGLLPLTHEHEGVAAVLRAADAACYAAKQRGGNRVHTVRSPLDPDRQLPPVDRQVTRLSQAVAEGQFRLFAQPIVSLQSARRSRPRFEILLRLPDDNGRMQDASEFLPQAERYHLMPVIDRWVVDKTIGLLGQWRQSFPDAELPICSINLSASAIVDAEFIPFVTSKLAQHRIPAHALCFEFQESSALANLRATTTCFAAIRTVGSGIALEDCGNDVNSFMLLRSLPVTFLKIGGRFVRDVAGDPMCGTIVRSLNQIGRSIGMSTIAKQVGTEDALRTLCEIGVGYAQGRALTGPMPFTDADGNVTLPIMLTRQPEALV